MSVVKLTRNAPPAEAGAAMFTLLASHEAKHEIFATHHVIASLAELCVESTLACLWDASLFVQAVALIAGGAFRAKPEVTAALASEEACVGRVEVLPAVVAGEGAVLDLTLLLDE